MDIKIFMEQIFESFGEFSLITTTLLKHEIYMLAIVGTNIVYFNIDQPESTCTISMSSWPQITSCIFLPDKSILVALNDSSLLLIPNGVISTVNLQPVKFRIQPIGLIHNHYNGTIIVSCDKNTIYEIPINDISSDISDFMNNIQYDKNSNSSILTTLLLNQNMIFSAFQKTNEVSFLFWNRIEISGSCKCFTENNFSYQWSVPYDSVNQKIIQICEEKETGTVQFITSCAQKGSDLKSTEVATNTKKKTRVFN